MKIFFAGFLLPLISFAFPFWFEIQTKSSPLHAQISVADDFFARQFERQKDLNFYENFSLLQSTDSKTVKSGAIKNFDGGIKEKIPKKFQARYENWKEDFLSTEFGRRQWNEYAEKKDFTLIITISEDIGEGAKTGKYVWNDEGKFVSATISLGNNIERGFPDPVYYPVMNSLSPYKIPISIDGDLLAATKIAHEFGHVNQTSTAKKEFFELQAKLMNEYTEIFLKNGRNADDPKLIELAKQMSGTPVSIWEDREYWSEVNAMLFLDEKISREYFFCDVLSEIKNNIELYAKNYEPRFDTLTNRGCKK